MLKCAVKVKISQMSYFTILDNFLFIYFELYIISNNAKKNMKCLVCEFEFKVYMFFIFPPANAVD